MSEEDLNDQLVETSALDENRYITQRREKLSELRSQGQAYPNDFRRSDLAGDLQAAYGEFDKPALEEKAVQASVAGRMMLKRDKGKVVFADLQDMSGKIQVFIRKDSVGDEAFEVIKAADLGDIFGIEGQVFRTNTGELSIKAASVRLLTKSLRPLPEKFHGLTDQEQKYRQRYVDLIVSEESRKVFQIRSQVVGFIRQYMSGLGFTEVETPMMQVIPGGATARPFVTHHNALDIDMYLRVAPELYLKRLVVGGIEQVFEINRNFRNEGLSTRHNPEFTMLEFYQAYANYNDFMDLTEDMLRKLAESVLGTTTLTYQGDQFDLSVAFERMTVLESIQRFNPELDVNSMRDMDYCRQACKDLHIPIEDNWGAGKLQIEIFEKTVEHRLMQPTFITAYPTEVSPLSRANDDDDFITDRFEFFLGGREIANGFSELNDPEDQAARFMQQVASKDAGDDEAMHYDADYIRALEYGMPPAAGEGIGIDRLVMYFTDSPSIRDVILFPHMRPEV